MFLVSRRALLLGSVTAPKVQPPPARSVTIPYVKHAVILGQLAVEVIKADRKDVQERLYLAKVLDAYDAAVSGCAEDPPFVQEALRSTLREPFPYESRYDT